MGEFSRIFVIADENVHASGEQICRLLQVQGLNQPFELMEWKVSEQLKTLQTAQEMIRELLARGADRKSFLVGAGGGVLTDIVGFVASVYMRGIRFAFIPTTLLAQVDAAIGGKNGVDLDDYKNIIGRISQPEWTCRDMSFLKTLPQAEWRNGLAEMLKTFILFDAQAYADTVLLFSQIFRNGTELDPGLAGQLKRLTDRCAGYKMEVVRRDEFESGERRLLNLGHTYAHAVEKCSCEQIPHGQAVAVGMIYAAEIPG